MRILAIIKGFFYIIVLLAIAIPSPVLAGRSCSEKKTSAEEVWKASNTAAKVYNALEESNAKVALVGRVGSDLSKYGLKYSHLGIIIRNHPKGRWIFVHELNSCGSSSSKIYDEGLVNFFLDDTYSYDAIIAIPSPEKQRQIEDFIGSGGAKLVHNPNYSMISNPFSAKYQNSNEFILGVVVASESGYSDLITPDIIAKFLQRQKFRPSSIKISPLKRLGARLFKANVQFDDHPKLSKMKFVSVKSVIDYLKRNDKATVVTEIKDTSKGKIKEKK